MIKFRLTIAVTFFCVAAMAQSPFRIMFYNVENFFDCQHDSLKEDFEFLPNGKKHWTFYRFKKKAQHISQTIIAASASVHNPPSLIGLCEVENKFCLDYLTKYSPLKNIGYSYIMTSSKDKRGIDVALLYLKSQFKILNKNHIHIDLKKYNSSARDTRDILYVKGMTKQLDTLNLFINHWPSRSGGELASEYKRIIAAKTLREAVGDLLAKESDAKIIIMGDFNDYPSNKSVRKALKVRNIDSGSEPIQNNTLYHLLAKKIKRKEDGSYKYQNEWNLLDHLIVNGVLLNKKSSCHTDMNFAYIGHFPFLLKKDTRGDGFHPNRTYKGPFYNGGYSDHLPVFFDLLR